MQSAELRKKIVPIFYFAVFSLTDKLEFGGTGRSEKSGGVTF